MTRNGFEGFFRLERKSALGSAISFLIEIRTLSILALPVLLRRPLSEIAIRVFFGEALPRGIFRFTLRSQSWRIAVPLAIVLTLIV